MIIIVKLNFHLFFIFSIWLHSKLKTTKVRSAHPNWRTGPFLLYNSIQMTFEGWINDYVRSIELEGL